MLYIFINLNVVYLFIHILYNVIFQYSIDLFIISCVFTRKLTHIGIEYWKIFICSYIQSKKLEGWSCRHVTDTEEVAGRGCSTRWSGLAFGSGEHLQGTGARWRPAAWRRVHAANTEDCEHWKGAACPLPAARCPAGFLLPAGIRSQRVRVALPASSLLLHVSDAGPTHEEVVSLPILSSHCVL